MPYLSLTGHSYLSSETLINNLILYLQKILAVDVVDLDLIFELSVMMKDTCSKFSPRSVRVEGIISSYATPRFSRA